MLIEILGSLALEWAAVEAVRSLVLLDFINKYYSVVYPWKRTKVNIN